MEILQNMDVQAESFIGIQSYSTDKKYVPSQYIYKEYVEDGWLYYNSFSKTIVLLADESEFYPSKELVENWFFFEEGVDQYALLMETKDYILKQQHNDLRHIVVFTTMGCNARCSYCYEKNYENKIPMSEKVALATAKWICNNVHQPYSIQWFGGEPLMNVKAIDTITEYLNENSPYEWSSTMVSNGYLIDQVGVDKLVDRYRLRHVQITLDGIYNDYNKVKNYVYKDDLNPFNKVIENIKLLLSKEIVIDIRLNVTKDNFKQLASVVSFMKEKFGDNSSLHVYSHPTYAEAGMEYSDEEATQIYKNYAQLQEFINQTFSYNAPIMNWESIEVTNCMADSGVGVCVTPIGNLSLCEHHVNEELIGNIFMDKFDSKVIEAWKVPCADMENCKTCPYKPMCFNLAKCPGTLKCNAELQRYRNDYVHISLKNWYTYYLENKEYFDEIKNTCFADVYLPENAVFLEDN